MKHFIAFTSSCIITAEPARRPRSFETKATTTTTTTTTTAMAPQKKISGCENALKYASPLLLLLQQQQEQQHHNHWMLQEIKDKHRHGSYFDIYYILKKVTKGQGGKKNKEKYISNKSLLKNNRNHRASCWTFQHWSCKGGEAVVMLNDFWIDTYFASKEVKPISLTSRLVNSYS